MSKIKNVFGFTIIELLVVIAIIGLISSLMLVVVRGKVMAARDAKRHADIATLMTAMELYKFDKTYYPFANLCVHHMGHIICASTDDGFSMPVLEYMKPSPPVDPGHHINHLHDAYYYFPYSGGHDYVLFFMLEKGPQEDFCTYGPIDLTDDGVVNPEIWSTRCPD